MNINSNIITGFRFNLFLYVTLIFCFVSHLSARQIKPSEKKVEDPIDSSFTCTIYNIFLDDKMLVSKNNGIIHCENTGYIAYINKKDTLTNKEKKSIKKFLKKAKKILEIEEFDFNTISIIDYLWLIKNIYERRNLSPKHHIEIMNWIEQISIDLTENIIMEKEELHKYCVSVNSEESWCRVFTLKNKRWEAFDASLRSQSVPVKENNE